MFTEFIKKLLSGWDGNCPCCGRYAKVYRRQIHGSIARHLIALYKAGGDEKYIHFTDFHGGKRGEGFDFPLAAHWGLLEKKDNADSAKKDSGCWKLTERGCRFVENKIFIPRYLMIFNDQVWGNDSGTVNISEALGKKWNYTELMSS